MDWPIAPELVKKEKKKRRFVQTGEQKKNRNAYIGSRLLP